MPLRIRKGWKTQFLPLRRYFLGSEMSDKYMKQLVNTTRLDKIKQVGVQFRLQALKKFRDKKDHTKREIKEQPL